MRMIRCPCCGAQISISEEEFRDCPLITSNGNLLYESLLSEVENEEDEDEPLPSPPEEEEED